jgi:serine/threonine protein kinase
MPLKLVVLAGPDEGRVFPVRGETMMVGRSRASDTRLIDPHVSRIHCQIVPENGRPVLLDFESAGGTFVNGQAVSKHVLKAGDLIRIGTTHLQVAEDDGATAKPAADPRRPAGEWAEELVGHTISHYKVGHVLARGHTGFVFHARDTRRNAPIALKVLSPKYAEDEKKVKKFVAAMKTVLPLRHPNLTRVYGAGRVRDHLWVALEYVAGDSLAAVVGRIPHAGKIDWKLIVRVAVYLARALDYAHGKQILHRNVTPQNVLLGRNPKDTKLADLMLDSAVADDPLRPIAASGMPSESLAYQAPERTDGPGAAVDARTDLYGLGATLYALFTGGPPFQGETVDELVHKIRLEAPRAISTYKIELPEQLDGLIRRLTAKRPQDRPASARVVLKELEGLARARDIPL